MTGWKARSLVSACAVTAVSAVAALAPGTASAECTGESIKANGSSLQASAQQKLWSPAFNKKCESSEPKKEQVSYESTSSGKGLASWWVGHSTEKYKGFAAGNAFVGTDQPPNPTQISEILEKGPGGEVLSIPMLQAAVALPIHLPEGCTAESGKKKKAIKRLVLSDAQLQGIFAHTITTWKQLTESANNYNEDKLVGASCASETKITRVVRKEGSGTTAITKKFLFEINKSAVDGSETWNELAEKNENLKWPEEKEEVGNLIRAEKGSGVAEKVAATPGSIGYANLNEVRSTKSFDPEGGGGEGTALFWPELQSKKTKFEDPATNGDVAAAANANCAGEAYISLNGTGKQAKFPPESTKDPWNEVTASTEQKASYPLCGFTYDLGLTAYHLFPGGKEGEVTTAAEVETIKHYFEYVLGAGQKELEGHDFLGLPEGKKGGNVLQIAQKGAELIAF